VADEDAFGTSVAADGGELVVARVQTQREGARVDGSHVAHGHVDVDEVLVALGVDEFAVGPVDDRARFKVVFADVSTNSKSI